MFETNLTNIGPLNIMLNKKTSENLRCFVSFCSSKACSWLAIFSLIFSSALTLTHHHDGSECGCGSHEHSTTLIAGLEQLPAGDCDCTDCEEPTPSDNSQHEHDEDSCSICRMVFEHAVQTIEFDVCESIEPSCDIVAILLVAHFQSTESGYLTRGPPAVSA